MRNGKRDEKINAIAIGDIEKVNSKTDSNIEKINIRSVAQAKRNRAVKIAKENHAIAVEENTNKKKKPRLWNPASDYKIND